MKIKALGDRIRVKAQENKAGGLDISSYPTAIEYGEIVDIGPDVTLPVKMGDKIFFKSWAVDIISFEGENYTFISQATGGICATIK